MKKGLRLLLRTMKNTHAHQIVLGFVGFLLVSALVFWMVEPEFTTYSDGLWYCYAVFTTVGFGDIVASTLIGKALSIFISIYAILVIAIVTGTVVSLYSQLVEIKQKESIGEFIDKLERLPELSKEELEEISKQVIKYINK